MYLCQKTIQHQSTDRKWWSNIFSCTAQTQSYTPLFLHTHVFYHCCRMLRISRCAWNYHLGVVIIVRPHIVLQKKSVLKQKWWGGGCSATILHIVQAPATDPRPPLLPWPWSQPGGMMLQEARCSRGDSTTPWWQPPLHLLLDWLPDGGERAEGEEEGGVCGEGEEMVNK